MLTMNIFSYKEHVTIHHFQMQMNVPLVFSFSWQFGTVAASFFSV